MAWLKDTLVEEAFEDLWLKETHVDNAVKAPGTEPAPVPAESVTHVPVTQVKGTNVQLLRAMLRDWQSLG